MNKFLKHLKAFFPAILWAGIIFFLSSQEVLPGLTLSIPDFILKKTAHILVFAVLYFLILKSFYKLGESPIQSWKKAFLICISYAILDELHQITVSGRSGTVRDVGFDFIGIGLAFLRKFDYI